MQGISKNLEPDAKRSAWDKIIEDFNSSNENQTSYCKHHGINKHQFVYYLGRWRKAKIHKTNITDKSCGITKVSFMPMEVTIPKSHWTLNIGNGLSMEFPDNVSMEQLSAFILNLRKASC